MNDDYHYFLGKLIISGKLRKIVQYDFNDLLGNNGKIMTRYLRFHWFSSRNSDIKPLRCITPKDYIWKGTIKGFRVNYNEPCSDTTARYYIEMTSGWDWLGWAGDGAAGPGDKRRRCLVERATQQSLLLTTRLLHKEITYYVSSSAVCRLLILQLSFCNFSPMHSFCLYLVKRFKRTINYHYEKTCIYIKIYYIFHHGRYSC